MEIRRERYKPRGDSPSPLHQRKKNSKTFGNIKGFTAADVEEGQSNYYARHFFKYYEKKIGPQYLKSWREKSTQTLLTKDLKNLGIKLPANQNQN